MNAQEVEKLGIRSTAGTAQELFERMVACGWLDGAGRSLTWSYWQQKRKSREPAGRD